MTTGTREASRIDFASVTIRRAKPEDADVLGKLGASLVQLHHEFDPARFIPATAHTAKGYGAFLVSQLDEADVVILVAEHGDDVLGYTYAGVEGRDYMSLRGPAGVLYDIVVDPVYRGAGVGHLLIDATVAELTARGAPQVVLSTAEQNESAQRLFAREGFRRTMIEMTRDLPAPDAGS